jgi:hypothetical protein
MCLTIKLILTTIQTFKTKIPIITKILDNNLTLPYSFQQMKILITFSKKMFTQHIISNIKIVFISRKSNQ